MSTKGKSWSKRNSSKKFRRLLKRFHIIGSKISGRLVGRASWGSGFSKKDLPKDEK